MANARQKSETKMVLHVEPSERLPDSDQWVNRFEIRSETSNRKYTVSQNRSKRHWGCSCPGWRSRRECKHLRALALPEHERPYEVLLA